MLEPFLKFLGEVRLLFAVRAPMESDLSYLQETQNKLFALPPKIASSLSSFYTFFPINNRSLSVYRLLKVFERRGWV